MTHAIVVLEAVPPGPASTGVWAWCHVKPGTAGFSKVEYTEGDGQTWVNAPPVDRNGHVRFGRHLFTIPAAPDPTAPPDYPTAPQ